MKMRLCPIILKIFAVTSSGYFLKLVLTLSFKLPLIGYHLILAMTLLLDWMLIIIIKMRLCAIILKINAQSLPLLIIITNQKTFQPMRGL